MTYKKGYKKVKLDEVILVKQSVPTSTAQQLGRMLNRPVIMLESFKDFKTVSLDDVQKLIDKARKND